MRDITSLVALCLFESMRPKTKANATLKIAHLGPGQKTNNLTDTPLKTAAGLMLNQSESDTKDED